MLDIDHFKTINDSQGHLQGDEVLLLLSQQMTDSFRENDLLFRYGGEEFAMVLMDITPEQARQSLDRFREKIAGYDFPDTEQVTVSIGFTIFDKSLTLEELINQADAALYYCKTIPQRGTGLPRTARAGPDQGRQKEAIPERRDLLIRVDT